MVLDLALRARVHALHERAGAATAVPGLVDLTPGVRSLQVQFDPARAADAEADRPARRGLDGELPATRRARRAEPHRPAAAVLGRPGHPRGDPALHARRASRMRRGARGTSSSSGGSTACDDVDDVHDIVFDAQYLVLGLGDVYLGAPVATPLDPRHRLVTTKYNPARTWTPENAVGIGGAYLCIYGMEGPGGYQFVGRTTQVWNHCHPSGRGRSTGTPLAAAVFRPDQLLPASSPTSCWTCVPRWPPGGRARSRSPTASSRSPSTTGSSRTTADVDRLVPRHQARAFGAERAAWSAAGEFAKTEAKEVAA